MTDAEMEARMIAVADAANTRIASCHEEVACPKCLAPVGERCIRMTRSGWAHPPQKLKHPHRERWTQVVPAR